MKRLSLILLTFAFNTINCASKLTNLAKCLTTTSLRNVSRLISTPVFWKQNICTAVKPANSLTNHLSRPTRFNNQKKLIYSPKRHLFFWRIFDENITVHIPEAEILEEILIKAGYRELVKRSRLIFYLCRTCHKKTRHLSQHKLILKDLIRIVEEEVNDYSRYCKFSFENDKDRRKFVKETTDDLLILIWKSRSTIEIEY